MERTEIVSLFKNTPADGTEITVCGWAKNRPHSAEPYQTNFYFHGRRILNIYSYSIIGVN